MGGASVAVWLTQAGSLAIKSLIIFSLGSAVLLVLRRASAAARHLVCLLTLAALLVLPVLSAALPGWRLTVLSVPAASREPTPLLRDELLRTAPPRAGEGKGWGAAVVLPSSPLPVGEGGEERAGRGSPVSRPVPWAFVLSALWLLGVLLACLRPLLGLWGIARLSRASVPVTDPAARALAAGCARALRLPRVPDLQQANVPVPMTWSWRRPVVLLPAEATAWPEGRLQAVLLHELAHVRRRDWLFHRFADCVCALYWFHPLVWLTARRLRAEGEIACDDLVLASGVTAPDYARHLLDVARALCPLSAVPQAAIAMARTSRLEGRLKMILDTTRPHCAMTRRILLTTLGLGAAALVPLAMLRPVARAHPALHNAAAPVALLGITDAAAQGGIWWDGKGKALSKPAPITTYLESGKLKVVTQSGHQGRLFAFGVPANLFDPVPSTIVQSQGGTFDDLVLQFSGHYLEAIGYTVTTTNVNGKIDRGESVTCYLAAFPASLTKISLNVGTASGPWTEVVDCPKTPGKVRRVRPSGEVIFTLIPNPHRLPAAQAARGNAVFMVSDHFRSPSLLKADNPLEAALHDGENYQRAVYALDRAGRVITKLNVTPNTWPDPSARKPSDYRLMKTQQTTHLPNALLKRVAAFRLVARPFQWKEFKDVALQPAQ